MSLYRTNGFHFFVFTVQESGRFKHCSFQQAAMRGNMGYGAPIDASGGLAAGAAGVLHPQQQHQANQLRMQQQQQLGAAAHLAQQQRMQSLQQQQQAGYIMQGMPEQM